MIYSTDTLHPSFTADGERFTDADLKKWQMQNPILHREEEQGI